MRQTLILLALLPLAGCGREEPAPAPAASEPTAAAPLSEPPSAPASFVGRWAAQAQLCTDGAWDFRPDGVSTAGEVSCAFRAVEPTASGYRIQAACTHEGSQSESEIGLSMTDPAPPQSMTVTGGPWSGPVTLLRCPG